MKTVVLPNDIAIPGVVNDEIYQRYIVLLKEDISRGLDPKGFKEIDCPGCRESKGEVLAQVMGMTYKACPSCGSYFVSARPDQKALDHFYKESSACCYWRQEMAALSDQKLYYIYGPRVSWVIEWADEHLGPNPFLLDYQAKYSFLVRHIQAQKVFGRIQLLEPQLYEQEGLLSKEFYAKDNGTLQADMLSSFESLERAADPQAWIKTAHSHCKSGGLLLLTTATSSGFEYQVLKGQAPNLNPINRLNLLSLEAIVALLEEAGFEMLELSTPGRLDVDIVKRALEKSDWPQVDPFWKYVFGHRQAKTFNGLQEFLQENRLSSHVRIVAKKR